MTIRDSEHTFVIDATDFSSGHIGWLAEEYAVDFGRTLAPHSRRSWCRRSSIASLPLPCSMTEIWLKRFDELVTSSPARRSHTSKVSCWRRIEPSNLGSSWWQPLVSGILQTTPLLMANHAWSVPDLLHASLRTKGPDDAVDRRKAGRRCVALQDAITNLHLAAAWHIFADDCCSGCGKKRSLAQGVELVAGSDAAVPLPGLDLLVSLAAVSSKCRRQRLELNLVARETSSRDAAPTAS